MNSFNSHSLSPLLSFDDGNFEFPPNINGRESNDIETSFIRNFSSYPSEEPNNEIISLSHDNSSNSIISMKDENPMPFFHEINHIFPGPPSNDSSSELSYVLISTDNESSIKEKEIFLLRKRSKIRLPRKYNNDDIRIKIKRGFLNDALKKKLNKALKIFGSRKYFENFPKQFASDPCKKRNKIILDMTLREIFEKKELYVKENKKGWANYFHNLKVVQSDEIKGNREFQKILNKTFRQLYEEYINSDVFKINEINRLIRKEMDDNYIQKYKMVAKHLISFFSN